MSDAVPYRLLRHQWPMLLTGARVVGDTLLKTLRPAARQAADIAPIARTLPAPPAELVARYLAWAGAADAWPGELPPHMVSQWSLPLVGELLLHLPYRLTSVINQGVSLRINGALPRDTPLRVTATLAGIEHTPGRSKVVVAIETGTAAQAGLLEAWLHMSFLHPGQRAARTARDGVPEPAWHSIGQWHAERRDGMRFALLTGDFNPIHWCAPLARRSVFRGMVLHGFGSFVRSYEMLARHGIPSREIDVRFVRPVPLPSAALTVQVADAEADGWRALRLAGADGAIHLAGKLR